MKKPVFSYLLISFNQENYIERTLQSILSQDYSPIEIVISDDNSSDGTFDVAQKIADNYTGPHKIILNRNPKTLGVFGNFYKAFSLSTGDWLFMASGDDISMSNRSEIVFSIIQKFPNVLAIGTARFIIDNEDKIVRYCDYDYANNTHIHGASAIWNRKLLENFEKPRKELGAEDPLLYFRVFLMKSEAVITNEVGLKYRIDGFSISNKKSTSFSDKYKHDLKIQLLRKSITEICFNDLESMKDRLEKQIYIELKNKLTEKDLKFQVLIDKIQNAIDIMHSSPYIRLHNLFQKHNLLNPKRFLKGVFLFFLGFRFINKHLYKSIVLAISNKNLKHKNEFLQPKEKALIFRSLQDYLNETL